MGVVCWNEEANITRYRIKRRYVCSANQHTDWNSGLFLDLVGPGEPPRLGHGELQAVDGEEARVGVEAQRQRVALEHHRGRPAAESGHGDGLHHQPGRTSIIVFQNLQSPTQ